MRRIFVLSLLVVVVSLSRPAAASCVPAPPLQTGVAEAPVVFVGTVLSTANRDRVAQVRVEEIWKGPDLPDQITVRGSRVAPEENAVTSIDRTFRVDLRYLFIPDRVADVSPGPDGRVVVDDSLCTATREYRPELDRLRPASVTNPTGTGGVGPTSQRQERLTVLPLVAAVSTVLALVGITASRRHYRRGAGIEAISPKGTAGPIRPPARPHAP